MTISNLLFGTAFGCVVWGVVSGIMITSFVADRGTKINFFLYRIYIFKYISQYKQITEAEDGRPGIWFYSYIFSFWGALAFALLGIWLRS